ncbi:hypothetical protein ULMS_06470 [Patiriisocius marinistellae]|uniref:Uncharacterized protein n=2 Tax=Patiriisocius marinistellae TaxID=2494560 RepID=A0A5J4FYB2_9FLAO|nr:hypothetical protein ULMS_06470 [Patiriisocius marinistellae]
MIAQQLTGEQLLDKAIAYHDPHNNWDTFKGTLNVTMETPGGSPRVSIIDIDLSNEYFKVVATRDSIQTMHSIKKGKCTTSITDSISEPQRRTPCETAGFLKNYYTYLYGLPMKLKDPGTQIFETVERKTFKGKEYLVLKATYDEAVGSDVWYFYFNPKTYAMETYQFFKGDPNAKGKDTGEYILLNKETVINDIKIPAIRAWFYNKDDKYLGTDILKAG